MDSQDSQRITKLPNNNAEPIIPNLPFVPPSDPISTPRTSRRSQFPLSRFESLPTEIHIAIIAELLNIAESFISYYRGTCKLARASREFRMIAQSAMYRDIALNGEEQAIRWLESDATIRGEFTTRQLVLSGEEGYSVRAETAERVLALQNSALKELDLRHFERVDSSSINALSGLRGLRLMSCDVTTTIDSAAKPTFQLQALYIRKSTFPPSFLRDIMTSSSTSLRKLTLMDLGDDFDWTSITPAPLGRLKDLLLSAPHIPPLLDLFSGCGNLTTLILHRAKRRSTLAIADSTNQFSHLSKELASLPDLTLKTCLLSFGYVGRSGGAVTLQEVEELIAIPSLANLERLTFFGSKDLAASDIEALKSNKGKKGKLVVKVEAA